MTKVLTDIPNLDICTLSEYREADIMVSRLAEYLVEHHNLIFPHRHNFYHLVFFTAGTGSHTIDFNLFSVKPFHIYFMIPGQVHTWDFEGLTDGYLVNFSESFFHSFLFKQEYLDSFSFFRGITEESVIDLASETGSVLVNLFEEIIRQSQAGNLLREDLVRVLLLQIFIRVEQTIVSTGKRSTHYTNNTVIRNFLTLIEKNLPAMRLPGEYADRLNITPNHLNALCKEHLGKQAGEVIRDRIILEAKRHLVSLDLTVSEIAYKLDFNDNSYFTKFFRKAVGITPEEFRKKSVLENK